MKLFIAARAKLNLTLDILYKRPDGYHQVEMLMQGILLSDHLMLEETAGGGVELYCSHPQVPGDESNLILKAARLLQQFKRGTGRGVKITLVKNIPLGAGLAGGSTDAAATLRGLNRIWDLGFSLTELQEKGSRLGADIPFCLQGGTCMARGKGEILEELAPIPPYWVLLLVFPFSVSTAEIYGSLDLSQVSPGEKPVPREIIKQLRGKNSQEITNPGTRGGNLLERVTLARYPLVAKRLKELQGKGYPAVQMTGSGPTLFILFATRAGVEKAARSLAPGLGQGEKIIITRTG